MGVSTVLSGVVLLAAAASAFEIMLPMRDGVKLHTVINLPLDAAQDAVNLTAIIDRSPYGADALELVGLGFGLAEGFVSVRQDQRGTQKSEGVFSFWHNAGNDTFDTNKYLTSQSWSNGRVVSIGASADGLASLAMMTQPQPHIKGQAVVFATGEGYETIFVGGAWRLSLSEFWLQSTVPSQAPMLIDELKANEAPSSFWDALSLTGHCHFIDFATSFSGWYDIFLVGNLIVFDGYYKNAAPSAVGQAVITVDPLGHCQGGAKYFSKNTILGRALLPVLQAYNTLAADGKAPGSNPYASLIAENVSSITFYVLGADDFLAPGGYWTSMAEWPTPTYTSYYLNSDKSLSTTAPTAASGSLSYKHDPADPVPSNGGNNLKIKCGPVDQTQLETRADVLTFTSEVLTTEVAITGAIFANLWVSSDALDTDFMVKLVDQYPEKDGKPGAALNVQDGAVRMRWRDLPNGQTAAKNMTAGEVYNVEVPVWNSSYVFAPGHQIKVEVASANYPRFSINRNSGWDLSSTDNGPNVTATNTVYMDASRPSSIILPVVTMEQLPRVEVLDATIKAIKGAEPAVRDHLIATAALLETQIAMKAGLDAAPEGLIYSL